MFRFSRPKPEEPGEPSPPPAPAAWGGVSRGYETPESLFGVRRLLLVGGVLLGGALLLLLVAQWAPGISAGWRPAARFHLWQAERLFARATEAERAGDLETARVAYLSALEARPDAPAPRWRLGRILGEEGRFDEAVAMLAPVTAEPSAFVHDTLLRAGKNAGLARFALAGLRREPARRAVWIGTLRLALARCGQADLNVLATEFLRAEATARPEEKAWLAAVRGEALGAFDEMAAALRALEAGAALEAADVLLGLELWTRAGRGSEAWVWVQRHRKRLGAFDAWFADWRTTLMRDPAEAARLLREIPPATLDASRWHRLAAAALQAGSLETAEALDKLAEGATPPASACVSMWAVLMSLREESAAREWAERFQRAGGGELPLLHGRALAGSDLEAGWRSALLLAAEDGLPRELMVAVALRRASAPTGE